MSISFLAQGLKPFPPVSEMDCESASQQSSTEKSVSKRRNSAGVSLCVYLFGSSPYPVPFLAL